MTLSDTFHRLKIFGRVDLDGTHTAIVEMVKQPEAPASSEATERPVRFVNLSAEGRCCACILSELREGPEDRVFVDRYKMWHLGLKDGDTVDFDPLNPDTATRVEIKTSTVFTDRDQVRFIGKPLTVGEKTALFTFSGEPRIFTVSSSEPVGTSLVTPTTTVVINTSDPESAPISYKDIGGLQREIKLVREVVEYPFRFGEVFNHLGVTPPKGIILHGPPGTGKTLIARALANEVGAKFYSISGPEVYSKWYGKSEQNLRNIFDDAIKNAPSVVVIDELDALVPRRDTTHGDQEQRIVATFLTQMDGLKEMKDVVVVGTTNRINSIDPALRRGGRFEHEVLIGVPDLVGREQILNIHSRRMPLHDDVDFREIAEHTNGLVGADLASLCREAAYNALRRTFPPDDFETGNITSRDDLKVIHADLVEAVRAMPPSSAREFSLEVPPVSWDDIGGLSHAKQILVENLTLGIKKKEAFARAGVRPAGGILLYGPTGTGKTMLARAVANECRVNFIAVKGSDIRFKWIGESEEKIKSLFARARLLAPCVMFFDEIDTALPARGKDPSGAADSIVNQILSEMDGVDYHGGVFVMGATNRIGSMDPAALRPGRFDHVLEIPLPDLVARRSIFEVHLKNKPICEDINLDALAEGSAGLSGAQIAQVAREAALQSLRDADFDADKISLTMEHISGALNILLKTVQMTNSAKEGQQ